MLVLSRILDKLCYFAKALSAFMLGVMLLVSLVEIVRRYVFGLSFVWADELIRYGMVVIASIGGAAAFREVGGLVAFDLIANKLKGRPGIALHLTINTICLVFAVYIFGKAVYALQTPSIVNQVSIGLNISMFWPYLPIALGMGLIAIVAVEKYGLILRNIRAGKYAGALNAGETPEGGDAG
ncbi:MAG: TRAP transporter small permease [Clostridiales Family XIII bacterium]|jgi:TRAP-type C4-dicarboxylate transport system permease small subunit|nr:TRAP transporter small permease [Clostridiales Family XIII bacterium]